MTGSDATVADADGAPVPEADAPDGLAAGADRAARVSPVLIAATVVLALVSVVAIGGAIFEASQARRARRPESQREAVIRASNAIATAALSYDAGQLSQDEKRVDALATASFAKSWHQSFVQTESATITSSAAHSKPQIQSVYVSTITGSTAGVIVVADFQVRTRTATTKVTGAYLRLTLRNIAGQWKVDTLDLVVGPQSSNPG